MVHCVSFMQQQQKANGIKSSISSSSKVLIVLFSFALCSFLMIPDVKKSLERASFVLIREVYEYLEPEFHESGTSRELRAIVELLRLSKFPSDDDDSSQDAHIRYFDRATEIMAGFHAFLPERAGLCFKLTVSIDDSWKKAFHEEVFI